MYIVDGKRKIFINEKNIRKLKEAIKNVSVTKNVNLILLPVNNCDALDYYYDEDYYDFVYDDGFIGIEDDGKSIEYHISEMGFVSIKPSCTIKELEQNLKQSRTPQMKEQINASLILEEDNNVNYLTEQDYFDIAEIISENQLKEYYEIEDAKDRINLITKELIKHLENKGYLFDDKDIKKVAESFISTELSMYETYTKNKKYHYSKIDIVNTVRKCFKNIYASNKKYYVEATRKKYPSIIDKVLEVNKLLEKRDAYYDSEIRYIYKEIEKYFLSVLDGTNEDLEYLDEKDLKALSSLFFSEGNCDIKLTNKTQKKKRR